MVDGVRHLGEIDRATCRHHVEANFSARAMADRYEAAYNQLLSPGPASAGLAAPDRNERSAPKKRVYDRRNSWLTQRSA
ncbi:hypothetical protein NITHO_5970005 [Nitrolancea hollandica Lb]|uniref:Uncharacterized protein n=1 Tax=Nitrolancea hollandica Lb TaxID=1129897 RepID=I4EME8_9BACT|nr:hypothetical protein NITHO_5970005 [Nitrolancea hollandica Lb]